MRTRSRRWFGRFATRQTAAPLLRHLGLPLRTEPWMHEIRSPVWQGTPAEKAEAAFKAERAAAVILSQALLGAKAIG